ncbi:unnamed protein product [uncultured archaeal virus]|jgi:hypothetical protein|uniref:Uncharacterized protein n=1 Tax=uncultured archaeal virus TaxID=1960247 RepID=A0ABM9HVR8_9VIRU|nr:unnamed protein product [uncultured archaeal virus]CAI3524031.1 unnamed protein product [uncultured archaeal virus]CAI4043412.1 unnamed protein product [uncultured archaeal virus]
MGEQKTLDLNDNLLGELDNETDKILGEALLKIGLEQGYCFTGRWYKIEASFYIVDNQTVKVRNQILREKVES